MKKNWDSKLGQHSNREREKRKTFLHQTFLASFCVGVNQLSRYMVACFFALLIFGGTYTFFIGTLNSKQFFVDTLLHFRWRRSIRNKIRKQNAIDLFNGYENFLYFSFSVLALEKGNNETRRSLMSRHKMQICINIL